MMVCSEIKNDVEDLIREVMIKKGVKEYDLIFDGKSEAGDNYAGEILFLRVVPGGGGETYNFVAKTAKRGKDLNRWMPIEMLYQREVLMYSKVFPRFKQLIEETGSGLSLDFLPKVHSISDVPSKQTIIFENLKNRGFKLHDRKKPWSLEQSLMAMKSYGEFHALSMALKHQYPAEFKELADQMPDATKEMSKNMDSKAFFQLNIDIIMENLKMQGREDVVEKFKGFLDETEALCDHGLEDEDERIIFSHADCWNNNFMFKYQGEQENKPTSICLLDFQISLPCVPVKDLSYNIYSTCDKKNLDHFDEILKTYYDSLSSSLIKLGTRPEDVFTFDQLKKQWKKYGKFGICTSIFILKICLVEKEDAPDFAKLSMKSENMEEFMDGLNIQVKNEDEYLRRISDVFIHFAEEFL